MSPVSRSTEQHSAKQENTVAHTQTLHEGVGSHIHTACVQMLSCVCGTSPQAGGRCSSGGDGGEHLNRRCCGRLHHLCADVQWTARQRHHHRCRQLRQQSLWNRHHWTLLLTSRTTRCAAHSSDVRKTSSTTHNKFTIKCNFSLCDVVTSFINMSVLPQQ